MELSLALQNIKLFNETFAKDEILCIRNHKEEAIPLLLEFIEHTIELHRNAEDWGDDLEQHYPHYAMFLLAEFKAHDAFPLFIKVLELDEQRADWMMGDSMSDDMGRMLGTVAKECDIERLKAIAENNSLNLFHRLPAMEALILLYIRGVYQRQDLIGFMGHLLNNYTEDMDFISHVVIYCLDVAVASEYAKSIEKLYKNDKINLFLIPYNEFVERLGMTEYEALMGIWDNGSYREITDTIESMGWWWSFWSAEAKTAHPNVGLVGDDSSKKGIAPNAKPQKIGRNAPCPCGSGKKYKRCCIANL